MAYFKSKKEVGLAPGSMVYVGNKTDEPVSMSILDYSESHLDDFPRATYEDIRQCRTKESVTWININGIHDLKVVETIGELFHLHPLLMEDIVDTHHRAKIDDYDDYLFVVLKMVFQDNDTQSLQFEHVCLILGPDFLISFQEREGDVFGPVRERLVKAKGRIRKAGADYLGYALIDMIVDHYYVVLERMGEEIEYIQEEALEKPTHKTLNDIHEARHRVLFLRKTIWPMRELVGSMLREDSELIDESVKIYLQDVYDHIIQVIDTVETYRDLLSGILDIYMSSVSNKMNEVMKVLTVIATLFIPLTFFTGVYGMNFKYMPELDWPYAYPVFWMLVVICFFSLAWWFKNKKWW